jgi:predicted naringenin-chalcone synthase
MDVEIISVATATPPHKLDQGDALTMVQRICCVDERQSRLATALYKHSGVQNRHTAVPYTEAYRWVPERNPDEAPEPNFGPSTEERMALYEAHALPLACEAATGALRQSKLAPSRITHVVTASCTGFTAPGVDSGLIGLLGLPPTTQRVHVGYMGCHGSINALRVAHGLASINSQFRILVCAVELCSLHYAFHWNSERMLGNALFADGAGAVVIGGKAHDSVDAAHGRWRLAATGSYLFPQTSEFMTWNVGNHGFAMTISPRLPELIQQNLGGWLSAWLAENQLRIGDIRSWAIHPGGPRILEAAESALGLTPDKTQVSREILSQHGNMSSATVLFIVEKLLANRSAAPCVMLGFGPGLVAEAALLR